MILYRICIFFLYLLCSWIIAIFKGCMIKGRQSHCLYVHKLYYNDSKLYRKWKMLQNVRYIYNVSNFRCPFSTFSKIMTILSKVTLTNANSTQTVMYFFLLMLCKVSTCKTFWRWAVVFSTVCRHIFKWIDCPWCFILNCNFEHRGNIWTPYEGTYL
jgi:hypothetical protein